jgi:hypothetical protein
VGEDVNCPHCGQGSTVPRDAKRVAAPAGAGETDEEEAFEEEEADTAMGWLALYLPSWGSSVVFHAALILLITLFGWTYAAAPSFEYDSQVVYQAQKKTHRRQKAKFQDDEPSRGKMTPRPSSFVKHIENPVPGVADNQMDPVAVIGVGGGGRSLGGFEGLGTGGRGAGFFGAGGTDVASKIVYVVDRSGSMTDSIDYVKFELRRAISELSDAKSFHIIFYSSGPPVEMPTRRLVDATEGNKQKAFAFIDGIIPHGQTDPSEALERAFSVRPELIYLLTDGEFDRSIVDLVKRQNSGGNVTVHTIAFLYRTGEEVLKEIASQNNGKFKFVSEQDLATLGQ